VVTFDQLLDCLQDVNALFGVMTERGMFDQLTEDYHPDELNQIYDRVQGLLYKSGRPIDGDNASA
jgi:hypothetical protein